MAIQVTVTIPDAHQSRIVEAFNTLAGHTVELAVSDPDFDGRFGFVFPVQKSQETMKDYGARVLRDMVKAIVQMKEYIEDYKRYSGAVAAIPPPAEDVPDDIVT